VTWPPWNLLNLADHLSTIMFNTIGSGEHNALLKKYFSASFALKGLLCK
jgi:hypothetical protein